ncbi:MAG: Bug family tripartite tricarboxylate transporter substrate binding protein [Lautropia sp.]
MRRTACLIGLMLACIPATHAQTAADDYPSKSVRVVLTVPPGGATDFIARTIGAKLEGFLGQPVVIENRGGASGTIAAAAVARAAPDGYTLMQNTITTHGIGPHLYHKLPYDSYKDFTPIGMVADLPLIMVVNAQVPANSVAELLALIKADPTKYSFASAGNATPPHMAGELFKFVTGVDLLHVPYKGSGAAVVDVVGGRVPIMFDAAPSLLSHIRSGKLRALAAASPTRNPLFPELPTFGELGYKGIEVSLWYGMLAPAGTPAPIVARLNADLQKVLASPDVKEKLAARGAIPAGGTPSAFASFMKAEYDRWGPVVKKAGVKID